MQWLALSPDMNCTEQLCGILSRMVQKHRPRTQNQLQLIAVLQQAWNSTLMVTIQLLVRSMPRRPRACLVVNGGPTQYWHFSQKFMQWNEITAPSFWPMSPVWFVINFNVNAAVLLQNDEWNTKVSLPEKFDYVWSFVYEVAEFLPVNIFCFLSFFA